MVAIYSILAAIKNPPVYKVTGGSIFYYTPSVQKVQ